MAEYVAIEVNGTALPVGVRKHLGCSVGQDRHILDLTAPAAFEHDTVQVNVGEVSLELLVAPAVDVLVDFLVQVGNRTRGDSCALQGLGNILHPANGDAGQVHLEDGFFD
jgi:hypothetical protein